LCQKNTPPARKKGNQPAKLAQPNTAVFFLLLFSLPNFNLERLVLFLLLRI